MAAQSDRGVLYSTLCPKFLHSNSTSHISPFSAIAELIDNAYDPDVRAKQFWIDKTIVKGQECLSFMDNGNGLNQETMHKMLSFGYSDKTVIDGIAPIGVYGNGFKSGSMRLGKDAIVFSKSESTSCVGMLSQTYLQDINADQIIVPIVCFEQSKKGEMLVREEHKVSLEDILRYSPFSTQKELLTELKLICPSWSTEKTGTRIIIWNLRRTFAENVEFDFQRDRYDIRLPPDVYEVISDTGAQPNRVLTYIPDSIYSLRAYCSILYLKPRMQIVIRGQKVKSQLIAKSLAYSIKDYYKPNFLYQRIPIIFGYNTKSKDQCGIMMYHKNRLIKAYERVGCQNKANAQGVGVIGVIECDFLEPTHNKQSFNENDKYRKTMNNLGIKLEDYWREMNYRKNKDNPHNHTAVEDTLKQPDQNWVQCDDCLHWRKLPDGIDCSKLPDKWFCQMNPDPQFRNCDVEEEPEDSDDDQPSYSKTYKQQERENKKQLQKTRLKDEISVANLTKENEELKRELLQKQLRQTPVPTTPQNRINTSSLRRPASSSPITPIISQKACSPSSSNGLPVISNVYSLSPAAPIGRGKRAQPPTPQTTPKRLRVNGLRSSSNQGAVPVVEDSDDTDDEIVIVENNSTPKPSKGFSLDSVKTETEARDVNMGILLECNDDAASDYNSATAGTSSTVGEAVGTATTPMQTSAATQTVVMIVKTEEEESGSSQTAENAAGMNQVDAGVSSTEQIEIKQENGVAPAGPSSANGHESEHSAHHLTMIAQERDRLIAKVDQLSSQLKTLQELSQTKVKDCTHQATQTDWREETEGEMNYKNLFSKANEKVNELIKEKEAYLAAAQSKTNSATDEETDSDEFALQVDRLMRELDQRTKEKDELRSQLDRMEEQRADLAAQCEELSLSLQQQRENADATRMAAAESTHSTPDAFISLVELRQNVGRLLVTLVPVLDPSQVNFECNVIDEILEQLLSDEEKMASLLELQRT